MLQEKCWFKTSIDEAYFEIIKKWSTRCPNWLFFFDTFFIKISFYCFFAKDCWLQIIITVNIDINGKKMPFLIF